ncbi:hypothetical protein HMPREF3226_02231 [Prevotella corporis]|uniref:Uncharacterized protein n=1 Tax=Prevotella corporis TaxID=28128 RepID=A0A133PXM6_9BACT|nr:hypothetical protein HMPREF3226_02231 [Prevotella corporis]
MRKWIFVNIFDHSKKTQGQPLSTMKEIKEEENLTYYCPFMTK